MHTNRDYSPGTSRFEVGHMNNFRHRAKSGLVTPIPRDTVRYGWQVRCDGHTESITACSSDPSREECTSTTAATTPPAAIQTTLSPPGTTSTTTTTPQSQKHFRIRCVRCYKTARTHSPTNTMCYECRRHLARITKETA